MSRGPSTASLPPLRLHPTPVLLLHYHHAPLLRRALVDALNSVQHSRLDADASNTNTSPLRILNHCPFPRTTKLAAPPPDSQEHGAVFAVINVRGKPTPGPASYLIVAIDSEENPQGRPPAPKFSPAQLDGARLPLPIKSLAHYRPVAAAAPNARGRAIVSQNERARSQYHGARRVRRGHVARGDVFGERDLLLKRRAPQMRKHSAAAPRVSPSSPCFFYRGVKPDGSLSQQRPQRWDRRQHMRTQTAGITKINRRSRCQAHVPIEVGGRQRRPPPTPHGQETSPMCW